MNNQINSTIYTATSLTAGSRNNAQRSSSHSWPNSTIHKAAIHCSAGSWKVPQRPFSIDSFTTFSGIVPGKARNGSASSFVNSTVTALFTKLPAPLQLAVPKKLPSGTTPRGCSSRHSHSQPMGHFSVEWWNSGIVPIKLWNGQEP